VSAARNGIQVLYPRCVHSAAVLLTTDELDTLAERILRADKELRPWLPELLAIYQRKGARRLPPLIRDSVGHSSERLQGSRNDERADVVRPTRNLVSRHDEQ
jgi:hypothetical protein